MKHITWLKLLGNGIVAASLLLGSTTVLAASTNTAKQTIEVKLVSADLTENNHVGNEWADTAAANGKAIKVGETIVLKLKSSESVQLLATATELDKYPDKGSAAQSVKVSSISKTDKNVKLSVTVTENRGRYSGNTATWKFVFSLKKKG